MGAKLHKLALSLVMGGLAAVVAAPAAEANRGNNPTTTTQPGYVPPPQYGQNPQVLPVEDPYAPVPVVEPTVVPVDLPAVTDPGVDLAGGGEPLAPAPGDESPQVLDKSETRLEPAPGPSDGFMGGILSRTGAETLPLARAGLAVVALGLGLVVLARRRRVDAASA